MIEAALSGTDQDLREWAKSGEKNSERSMTDPRTIGQLPKAAPIITPATGATRPAKAKSRRR